MDMQTYFEWPEFTSHPEADHYRQVLGAGLPPSAGEIREGMLQFKDGSAWGGPYPGQCAHFILLDQRVWGHKHSGPSLADAREAALTTLRGWLTSSFLLKGEHEHFEKMRGRVEAWDADAIHQITERGTQEYPIRIWCMGNDDTSYSKWFKTVEEAEALLKLLESFDDLRFIEDFLGFDWTFTN